MDDWHEKQRRIEKRALFDEIGFFVVIAMMVAIGLAVLCLAALLSAL